MRVWKQTVKLAFFGLLVVVLTPAITFAAQSSSNSYQVNEVFFGSGGELNACSGSYCSKQSAGETAVGNTASTNFQAQGGFNTNREPYIEFTVGTTNVDLGTMTPTTTKTTTATFSVKSYLSNGYTVTSTSDTPKNNTYHMAAITIPSASQVGTEQFGINLVANTLPTTFGADPTQGPDTSFGFGQVAVDYSSPNIYKYVKDDTIALSTASSSYTNYTISYLFNISNVTPGGTYSLEHDLVATATY
ncbi:MAG: exported protein of unknown function [Candidatus Saccharibacteria bacterium]|nr:exported protein of unknown function [Candidatus Saccharibacteria bacterium]